jgi:hypothetical protein
MRIEDAKRSIERLTLAILNPLGRPRKDGPRPWVEEEQGQTCHFARVTAGTFMRDAKGPSEELALAKLVIVVEAELAQRIAAQQDRLLEEEGTIVAARQLLTEHAARKAVG